MWRGVDVGASLGKWPSIGHDPSACGGVGFLGLVTWVSSM